MPDRQISYILLNRDLLRLKGLATYTAYQPEIRPQPGGYAFKTKQGFYVNAQTSVQINGQSISLLKGKIKFSDASIQAKASGSVSISGGMIKIG